MATKVIVTIVSCALVAVSRLLLALCGRGGFIDGGTVVVGWMLVIGVLMAPITVPWFASLA